MTAAALFVLALAVYPGLLLHGSRRGALCLAHSLADPLNTLTF